MGSVVLVPDTTTTIVLLAVHAVGFLFVYWSMGEDRG